MELHSVMNALSDKTSEELSKIYADGNEAICKRIAAKHLLVYLQMSENQTIEMLKDKWR